MLATILRQPDFPNTVHESITLLLSTEDTFNHAVTISPMHVEDLGFFGMQITKKMQQIDAQ